MAAAELSDLRALGVDIGGTKLAVGVLDSTGRVLAKVQRPTPLSDGYEACLAAIADLVATSLSESRTSATQIAWAGVGCGGPLDREAGIILSPPNLPGWDHVSLVRDLEEALGFEFSLSNDADAAAIAEYVLGAHNADNSLAYVTVSTGCGAGLVVNGSSFVGSTGSALEIGHVSIDPLGRPCRCGNRGCLEMYVSGTAIAERARETIALGADSALSRLPSITAVDVVRAASQGDRVAIRLWDETTTALAAGLAVLVNVVDPEVIVLGGGVTRSGRALFDPTRTKLNALPLMRRPDAGPVPVRASALGDDVGIVGAALNAMSASERERIKHQSQGIRPRIIGVEA